MDTEDITPARRGRGRGAMLAGAGLVAGITVAGLGVASAQAPNPSESPESGTTEQAPGPGRGRHGKGGLGPGIHGEFTTAAPSGGWQTIATQAGEVTAVSATSITVRSEDGFSRTYRVDDNTLVNAGNEGIADVRTGDDVRVTAVVTDGTASAVGVTDATQVGRLRERWRPARPEQQPTG